MIEGVVDVVVVPLRLPCSAIEVVVVVLVLVVVVVLVLPSMMGGGRGEDGMEVVGVVGAEVVVGAGGGEGEEYSVTPEE